MTPIEKLADATRRLAAVVADPHPGTFSWHVAIKSLTTEIGSYGDTIPGSAVQYMRLCEQHMLVLHPNTPYIFEVDEKCEKCMKIAMDDPVYLDSIKIKTPTS